MADRTWNMLKLVPSISASRKNSMITGLARIDDYTKELVLSLYHLPDPKEFLNVKNGTYYAWIYDGENKIWQKIGRLQQKNGLTFSLKKKMPLKGDGIFVTAEVKGHEPKEPSEVIVSSNTELFYQDLIFVKEEEVSSKKEDQVVDIEVEPDILVESVEEEQIEEQFEKQVEERVEERVEEQVEEKVIMEKPDILKIEIKDELDKLAPEKSLEEEIIPKREQVEPKENLIDLEGDIPVDEFVGVIKDRFDILNKEINFKKYWDEFKEYIYDLYEEMELYEFYDEIKEDIKELFDRLDLEKVLNHVKDIALESVEDVHINEWIKKTKCFINDLEIEEWYCKIKSYIEAILKDIDLNKFWDNTKCWIDDLFTKMDIDQIMIWIKLKVRQMQKMNGEELRIELKGLLSETADRIQMPELKLAVLKVILKDKLSRFGDFFQQIKEKAALEREISEKPDSETSQKINPTKYPKSNNYVNYTQNPYPYKARSYSIPSEFMSNQNSKNMSKNMYSPHCYSCENSPYAYRAIANQTQQYYQPEMMGYGYYPQMNYNYPWMYPSCYQNFFQIGYDAMGIPRYLYDEEDEGYYFITPEGEIIRKS